MKNKKKIEKPALVCIDDLCVMSDDEIFALQRKLESERQFLMSKNEDSTLWEIELCYIFRELQQRSLRNEAHKKYLSSLLHEEHVEALSESYLDSPDLDNSEFVRLCAQREMLRELRDSKKKQSVTKRNSN